MIENLYRPSNQGDDVCKLLKCHRENAINCFQRLTSPEKKELNDKLKLDGESDDIKKIYCNEISQLDTICNDASCYNTKIEYCKHVNKENKEIWKSYTCKSTNKPISSHVLELIQNNMIKKKPPCFIVICKDKKFTQYRDTAIKQCTNNLPFDQFKKRECDYSKLTFLDFLKALYRALDKEFNILLYNFTIKNDPLNDDDDGICIHFSKNANNEHTMTIKKKYISYSSLVIIRTFDGENNDSWDIYGIDGNQIYYNVGTVAQTPIQKLHTDHSHISNVDLMKWYHDLDIDSLKNNSQDTLIVNILQEITMEDVVDIDLKNIPIQNIILNAILFSKKLIRNHTFEFSKQDNRPMIYGIYIIRQSNPDSLKLTATSKDGHLHLNDALGHRRRLEQLGELLRKILPNVLAQATVQNRPPLDNKSEIFNYILPEENTSKKRKFSDISYYNGDKNKHNLQLQSIIINIQNKMEHELYAKKDNYDFVFAAMESSKTVMSPEDYSNVYDEIIVIVRGMISYIGRFISPMLDFIRQEHRFLDIRFFKNLLYNAEKEKINTKNIIQTQKNNIRTEYNGQLVPLQNAMTQLETWSENMSVSVKNLIKDIKIGLIFDMNRPEEIKKYTIESRKEIDYFLKMKKVRKI